MEEELAEELAEAIRPMAQQAMNRAAEQELVDMVFGSWPGLVVLPIVIGVTVLLGYIPINEIPLRVAAGTMFYIAAVLMWYSVRYVYLRFVRAPQLVDAIVNEKVFIIGKLEDLDYPYTVHYKVALYYRGNAYIYQADSFVRGENSVCFYGLQPIVTPALTDVPRDIVSLLHKPRPFPPTIMVTEPNIIGGNTMLIYHPQVQSVSTDTDIPEGTTFSYLRLNYKALKEVDCYA